MAWPALSAEECGACWAMTPTASWARTCSASSTPTTCRWWRPGWPDGMDVEARRWDTASGLGPPTARGARSATTPRSGWTWGRWGPLSSPSTTRPTGARRFEGSAIAYSSRTVCPGWRPSCCTRPRPASRMHWTRPLERSGPWTGSGGCRCGRWIPTSEIAWSSGPSRPLPLRLQASGCPDRSTSTASRR